MNRIDLYRVIGEVQQDHLQRLTLCDEIPMKPRGRRIKRRPNTALIAEAARAKDEEMLWNPAPKRKGRAA